jgi:hypothetical protein
LEYYFVAKSPAGDYVGQLTLEDINQRLSAGELSGSYVAARSSGGNYNELIKSGTATWMTVAELVANPVMQVSTASPVSNQVSAIMRRYSDAYLVAKVTNGFGGIIKGIGVAIAVLLLLIGFMFISNGRPGDATFAMGVVTIVAGIIAAVWFYIVGVLVSAQGQILKASLDSAVNSSPFLTNAHRANIMSLPEAESK